MRAGGAASETRRQCRTARGDGRGRSGAALSPAARDPPTPWAARLLACAIVAYALSPIDLIPDVIPVLGLLAEAILLPLLMLLVGLRRMAAHRAEAESLVGLPASRAGALALAALWAAPLPARLRGGWAPPRRVWTVARAGSMPRRPPPEGSR